MSAVIEAIGDAIEGVVDAVGDVVEGVVDLAEDVIETVADNPLLIVAAIAAPFALSALAAEAAVVGVAEAAAVGTAAEAATAASIFEVAGAAEAVASGTAVLEATGAATAVASAETVAASTLIEAGAGIEAATAGATAVAEGATVAEAVTAASSGTVTTSGFVEAATSAFDAASSAVQTLSQSATNIVNMVGETLLPGADPLLQKFAGNVALNTATNGGNFPEALTNGLISVGTGFVGSEVAAETGSKVLGQTAASTLGTIARGGDLNATNIGANLAGNFVGSEITDETGSNLAGRVASSVTKDLIKGNDVTNNLLNLGINELGNAVTGQIGSFVNSASDAITAGGGTSRSDSEIDTLVDEINSANDDKGADDTTVGGLTAVSDASLAGTASTSGANKVDDTTLDTSTLTGGTTSTTAADTSNLFGSGADGSFTLTGGSDVKAGTGDVDQEEDTTTGGLGAVSTVTGGTGKDTVTGGLTQAQQDLIDAGTSTTLPATVTSAADTATVGGLNQVAGDQDTTTNAATTGATTGAAATGAAGTNILGNIIKKTVANTASTGAKNVINTAAGRKTVPTQPVAKQLTGNALNAIRANVVPQKVDISKLIPKQVVKAAPPKKVDVSKLTPVGNISGLSALVKGKG